MNSIVQMVLENSQKFPERDAIIYNEIHVTYGMLAKKILSFSNYLKKKKVKKGSKIVVEAEDPILFYTVFLAVQLNNCIVLPVERGISLYQLQEIINGQKPAMVFSRHTGEISKDFFNHDEESLWPEAVPVGENVAAIISTTGTTGKPVMIVHTNESILSTAITYLSRVPMKREHVVYTAVPFHLAGGFRRVLAALYVGAASVISHNPFSAESVFYGIEKYGVDFLCTVSSNISMLFDATLEQQKVISEKIQIVETYAGRLTSQFIIEFYRRFPNTVLYNVYGTTESGCLLINNTKENPKDSCVGKPTELAEVFLVDENGNIITKPGKYGYFAVKGPVNMMEYYKKKPLTRQVLRNGILKINDIGYFDEDGYYYYVSRVGDIMNINGYTIVPEDIECVAIQYPYIFDCACACTEAKGVGQLPVLYVVAGKQYDKKEMYNFLLQHLEPYKMPAAICEVANIPRTTTGKVVRNVLPLLTTI